MARATHLTIGTADRIRLDASRNEYDEEEKNGENEVRQEVQVSVTYVLDPGDTDLTLLTAEKAEEVRKAHEAAWNRIGAFSSNVLGNSALCGNSVLGRFSSPENETTQDANDTEGGHDDRDDSDDEPQDDGLPPSPCPLSPPAGAWYLPGSSRFRNGMSPEKAIGPDRETNSKRDESNEEPVTGPQKILIRSRAKKVGLTAYALERLVFQQFKVWKVERLSKAQAALLLDALERDMKEQEMNEKAGTKGSSFSASGSHAA